MAETAEQQELALQQLIAAIKAAEASGLTSRQIAHKLLIGMANTDYWQDIVKFSMPSKSSRGFGWGDSPP